LGFASFDAAQSTSKVTLNGIDISAPEPQNLYLAALGFLVVAGIVFRRYYAFRKN
jgi:hypothetical protein